MRPRLAVALAGLGAAAAQVLLIRELLVASSGNELSIAAVLSSWLLWSAAGSWLGGRVVSRSSLPPLSHVSLLAVFEAPVFALALAASRGGLYALREVLGGALLRAGIVPPPGGTISLPQLLLLTTLVTAPAGLLLGWQFAAGCRLLEAAGGDGRRGSSLAYVFDSLGHLVGGALLSIAAVTRLPAEWTLLGGWLLVLAGVWLLRPQVWRAAVGLGLAGLLALAASGFRERTTALRWAPFKLADSREGPFGNVSVLAGEGGELAFFENGAHAFETGEALAGEQWVDIPLLEHPSPKRVLLIGGGPRVLREVLRHSPESVSYFEIDPTMIAAIRAHAPEGLRRVLDDPRVTVSVADARLHLPAMRRAGADFDVVLVALSDPTTAQINRYYTLEWFRQVAFLIRGPYGLVAFQAMSSADYLSPELRSYDACLYRTAEKAGLKVSLFPGPQMTMVAHLRPGERRGPPPTIFDDLPALEARIRSRGMDPPTLLGSFYDALDPFRRQDRLRDLQEAPPVRLNRDFSPTCYYYAQVLWASWWRGWTAALLRAAERLPAWVLILAAVLLPALLGMARPVSREPARVIVPYALLAAGAGGMILEVVLLLGLQSLYGYVYGLVGYVLGVLMAGLALGAWWAQRGVTAGNAGRALSWALGGLAASALLTVVSLQLLQRGLESRLLSGVAPIAIVSVLMAATGLSVGACFPAGLAALGGDEGRVRRATALYAADLLGASGGALLAGLLLVPLFGTAMTCWLVLASAAAAAVLARFVGRTGGTTG